MPIDKFRRSFAPRRATARILADGSLPDRHAAADARLQRLMAGSDSLAGPDVAAITAARAEVEAIEAEIEDAQQTFVFEGIGRQRWLDLVAQHPPCEADRRDGYDFDPREFPAAAITASCVDPGVTIEEATWLVENLDIAEFKRLWDACCEANLGVTDRPKSVTATALRLSSARSSTTAGLEGSHDPSS